MKNLGEILAHLGVMLKPLRIWRRSWGVFEALGEVWGGIWESPRGEVKRRQLTFPNIIVTGRGTNAVQPSSCMHNHVTRWLPSSKIF